MVFYAIFHQMRQMTSRPKPIPLFFLLQGICLYLVFGLRVCFMFSLAQKCILIYSIRWEIRLQYLSDSQEKWQLLSCWFIFYRAWSPSKNPALCRVASVLTLKYVSHIFLWHYVGVKASAHMFSEPAPSHHSRPSSNGTSAGLCFFFVFVSWTF